MPDLCTTAPPAPCVPAVSDPRVLDNFTRRFNAATRQALFPIPPHTLNGDELLPDKCATFSKCIRQSSPGKVDLYAFRQFQSALASGSFSDFDAITMGGTRPLNGPMAAYAKVFCGSDSSQFGDPEVPAPWKLVSEEYAAELIELYWCSLLRDVPFASYPEHEIANEAARELSALPGYKGPRDARHRVTPALLFRGALAGDTTGPYISQFLSTPTSFGPLPVDQKYITYEPGIDYMTDLPSWYQVQSGIPTGLVNQSAPSPRHLYNGRGLAAYTHVDELFQAYFTAYLVLRSIGAPANPQSPYILGGRPLSTQNGFGTFGPPDIASTLAQAAKVALNACWYQKWVVHLRHRPEAGGGLVHLVHNGVAFDAQPSSTCFNSGAVHRSYERYGSYLLSQTYPEGSPMHPAYPTGHGAVGGACITILKFFFDGNHQISNPQCITGDGREIRPGKDDRTVGGLSLTVNGELHKLAHNITYGHGLHAGVHWRSDSEASLALGEAVAIRFLEDLAVTYAEPVNVTFTKLDGSMQTISNQQG